MQSVHDGCRVTMLPLCGGALSSKNRPRPNRTQQACLPVCPAFFESTFERADLRKTRRERLVRTDICLSHHHVSVSVRYGGAHSKSGSIIKLPYLTW